MTVNTLQNKKILLGVTGSIAAYKSAELIRVLKEAGAEVKVVMSEGANAFIAPLTLQALSGNPVSQHLLDPDQEATMSHITLARWADLILIAPATAHVIAKLAAGFADDLLTTLCLATYAPIAISPAMNTAMWSNSITQSNVQQLAKRNIRIIGPATGIQACSEVGEGRMSEPEEIVNDLNHFFKERARLHGMRFVITAGPTQEAIDPVRYLTNQSSGKMGYAIARAAAMEGAEVTLISGPTMLPVPQGMNIVRVTTCQQMLNAVMSHIENCDVFISSAAVSDYRVADVNPQKIKKSNTTLQLELIRNPDIISHVTALHPKPIVVGFAAETENVLEYAKQKLQDKKMDWIVANHVGENKGFNSDFNELMVMSAESDMQMLSYASKDELAKKLIDILIHYINK